MSKIIKPEESVQTGIMASAAVGLAFAMPIVHVLPFLPWQLKVILAVAIAAGVGRYFFSLGPKPNLPLNWVGVGMTMGKPNGNLYYQGEYWVSPLDSLRAVSQLDTPLNPPPVKEPTRNRTVVTIDGFLVVNVFDGVRFFKAQGAIALLKELFNSQVRKFVSQWEEADYLVNQKELLTQFMNLDSPASQEAMDLRNELLALVAAQGGNGSYLRSSDAVDAIMKAAGKFRDQAEQWGIHLHEVEIESISLPPELEAAAAKRRAQKDEMEALKTQATAMKEMANDLVASDPKSNLGYQDALTRVQILMKLGVTLNVEEWKIQDLDKVATVLGPEGLMALQRFGQSRAGRGKRSGGSKGGEA